MLLCVPEGSSWVNLSELAGEMAEFVNGPNRPWGLLVMLLSAVLRGRGDNSSKLELKEPI